MHGAHTYSITARNVGLIGVMVTSWGLQLPGKGNTLVSVQPMSWQGRAVPITLDAGHSATWHMTHAEVVDGLRSHFPPDTKVRGMVRLGTGEMVVSKNTIAVRCPRPTPCWRNSAFTQEKW